MSPASILAVPTPPNSPRPEQRLHNRYQIALNVQYKLRKKDQVVRFGSGRTLNISSGGILFHTKDPLPASGEIEIALDWPLLLDQHCPLRLLAHGRIVRNDALGTAVRFRSYEFRTSKRRST